MLKVREITKKIYAKFPARFWILGGILLLGIFLRTYHFREWLYFYPDQARDATLADNVISGKSSWPLLGPIAASTQFKLGSIYYYFQITSAEIFGSSPWSLAYPDFLFAILSIPLLYIFLRRALNTNLSLALTGLYSVSFYVIHYSRFAWNPNSIPFFVILFLLSLNEFLFAKGKTHWGWIFLIGIAFGVGVQLHTVLLVLLPLVSLLAFAYTMLFDRRSWKKWVVILLVALALNAGQLISEAETNFQNTKYFFSDLDNRSPHESNGLMKNIALDAICHAQANVLFVSSLENNSTCDSFSYFSYDHNAPSYVLTIASISFGSVLFLFGYGLLVYYTLKEKDKRKKYFGD